MKKTPDSIFKVIKWLFIILFLATILFVIYFFSVITEEVRWGESCGAYLIERDWYNPMGCICIGKKIEIGTETGPAIAVGAEEGEKYINYYCKGIYLYTGYE